MIAASLREGDELVDLLLNKEADVNAKSEELLTQFLVFTKKLTVFCVQIIAGRSGANAPFPVRCILTAGEDSIALLCLEKQPRRCPEAHFTWGNCSGQGQKEPASASQSCGGRLSPHGDPSPRKKQPGKRHRYLRLYGPSSW